jgi:pimeloyl-ACP methyl ester carboxylesterase
MRDAFRGAMTLEQVEQQWGGVADPADAALARRPGPEATPAEVNAWWESLTSAEQMAVIAAAPGSIGNLDGVPAAARDQANRTALARDVAEWELLAEQGTISRAERRILDNARAAEEALFNAEERVDPRTFEPVLSRLYMYDPGAFGGDGRMALTYGDPDTADHLSVHVPGMTTDMGSAPGNGDDAWAAYAATRSVTTDTVATMAWIGYDAPDNHLVGEPGLDVVQVASEGLAERGGERLADTMAGIDALRDDDPHVTVVGHSYGSTTVGRGAADHGLPGTDDIVLIGSPGAGGDNHAADLGVDTDRVWVGTNSSDPVGYLGDEGWVGGLGTLGNDPSNVDFGGQRFQAEDTQRFEGYNYSIDQHTSYYEKDSESLFNISQVIAGRHENVTLAQERHDPWYWEVVEPEKDREVTNPHTGQW